MAAVRKLTITLAAVLLLLLLGTELSRVDAQGCDESAIINALGPCFPLASSNQVPTKGSSCCNSVDNVKNSINPTDACMCQTASNVAGAGVTKSDIATMISACESPQAVPACLNS